MPGINIQSPISTLIVSGQKVIETRTYELPKKYIGKEMYLIETPGKNGKFKARAIAVIMFTRCFKYKTKKEFYEDFEKHKVDKRSPWAWQDKDKWGWELELIKKIPPVEINQARGIVFTKEIKL